MIKMIEIVGCVLLGIIGLSFILMMIDELRTNYEIRKSHKNSYITRWVELQEKLNKNLKGDD